MEQTHNHLLLPIMNIFYYVQKISCNFTGYLSHHMCDNRKFLMMCYGFLLSHRYDKNIIFPLSEVEFEGHFFSVLGDLHRYLTCCSGHYTDLFPSMKEVVIMSLNA